MQFLMDLILSKKNTQSLDSIKLFWATLHIIETFLNSYLTMELLYPK